jgi:hypothetical protein
MQEKKLLFLIFILTLLPADGLPQSATQGPKPAAAPQGAPSERFASRTSGQLPNVAMVSAGWDQSRSKPIVGAPYSGEEVTEMRQVLTDGSRLENRRVSRVWRDSQGRTRREETPGLTDPRAASGQSMVVVVINDPVGRVHYILHPHDKTAHKLPLGSNILEEDPEPAPAGIAPEALESRPADPTMNPAHVVAAPSQRPAGAVVSSFGAPFTQLKEVEESLGTQTIERLLAEGKRETTTIPAGQIGNEKPVEIVYEYWLSPELQVLIHSMRTDPRVGEVTFRLTNVQRVEPALTMFTVPSDYTVMEIGQEGSFSRK